MSLLLSSQLALLVLRDLAAHLVATLLVLALGFAGLALGASALERVPKDGARQRRVLLGVAVLMRVTLLPLEPTLSDDLYRYAWEGRVLAAGGDPYRLPPNAPELAALRDEIWSRTAHREIPSVYPPFAQLVFAAGALTPAPLPTLKILLSLADLAGCWMLLGLAAALGLPLARAAWYAWNPLVVLEVAGMGHVEPLGVAACIACVLLLVRQRTLAAGVAAGLGALAKLAPLAAFPLWARRSSRPKRFLLAALTVTAVGLAPVLFPWRGVPAGFVRYGVSWEFNGPLFEPLWRGLALAGAPGLAAAAVDRLKDVSGHHEFWNRLYPLLYPQLLAKLLLAVGMLTVTLLSLRERDPLVALRNLFGRLLLLSATVYPWYALWYLPWASLSRDRAWLALSCLLPLSYLPQHGGTAMLGAFLAIWLPFAALLGWDRARARQRARQEA